jgi:hypothetical protein
MQSAEQTGIDEALSRPAQFAAGATAWAGGVVLAMIAAIHVQSGHVTPASASLQPAPALEVSSTACEIPSDEATASDWDDTLEPPATFYPEDTIIAPRPVGGVTEMQSQSAR